MIVGYRARSPDVLNTDTHAHTHPTLKASGKIDRSPVNRFIAVSISLELFESFHQTQLTPDDDRLKMMYLKLHRERDRERESENEQWARV